MATPAFLHRGPALGELLCAIPDLRTNPPFNRPSWSPCYEIWASLFFPAAFWLAARHPRLFLAVPPDPAW